ncbi:hypothetical protein J2S43_007162 [Catenuloplanes nepalensis]|uniref:DUF6311 domain-containing protein n=1 Tax=Catenuloplanes nepalensis TaxID=587533 RepID=A0ABT9N4L4_9ACTN|nr:hypothetical protein [Catenuloplanes nepalensis]MDP9798650.1 hypothetical protein [Catenuloplanes nepalensis]
MTIQDIDPSNRPLGVAMPSVDIEAERILLEQDLEQSSGLRSPRWRARLLDLAAVASFALMAFLITRTAWLNLDHELVNAQDQAFFEWMLAHGARVVTDFAYPFVSYQVNVPYGINLMANTSVLAVSIPMTPITLAFGPHIAFNVFLTGALLLTGLSWYYVLSRHIVTSKVAAWVGALFAAFAPSMVAHANGHPNIISQFLIPLIIWRTLCLVESGRSVRNGALLGLLIVWQAFINLEILFMTAVGVGVFVVIVGLSRAEHRRHFKTFVAGLGVTAGVALTLLAYPLYIQFFGPQSYHGLAQDIRHFGADLGSYWTYSRRSIAGDWKTTMYMTQNSSEENAFFGWGIPIVFIGLVVWMRRSRVAIGLASVALLFAFMSLGPAIHYIGTDTGVPGLWALLHSVPILNSVVPTRWALAVAPVIAILLALGVQRVNGLVLDRPKAVLPVRLATTAVLSLTLIPMFPTPLLTQPMMETPAFITNGTWREYVDEQHTVVTLPLPDASFPAAQRWSAITGNDMRLPRGYGLFPNWIDGTGAFSAEPRATSQYFYNLWAGYWVPKVDDTRRAQTLDDLRYWEAGLVVLPPQAHDIEMRRAMSDILGFQPKWVEGVWIWDVRHLTSTVVED